MKNTYSIKKNSTLKYVLKKGKYCNSKHIVIHFTENSFDKNLLGICVSKKNGNSVQRNKMKRWAREVYKIEEQYLKKGINIIILYKKETIIDKIDFNIVKDEVIKCLKELNLYEENN